MTVCVGSGGVPRGISRVLEVGDVLTDRGATAGCEEQTTDSEPLGTGSISVSSSCVAVRIGQTLTEPGGAGP